MLKSQVIPSVRLSAPKENTSTSELIKFNMWGQLTSTESERPSGPERCCRSSSPTRCCSAMKTTWSRSLEESNISAETSKLFLTEAHDCWMGALLLLYFFKFVCLFCFFILIIIIIIRPKAEWWNTEFMEKILQTGLIQKEQDVEHKKALTWFDILQLFDYIEGSQQRIS